MLEVISFILCALSFSFLTIIFKKNEKNGVHILSIPALYILCLPFFYLTFYLTKNQIQFTFSYKYLFFVLLWAIPNILSNKYSTYTLRYNTITDAKTLKLIYTVFFAIILDIFYFKTKYNFLTFLIIILFFIANYFIRKNIYQIKRSREDFYKITFDAVIILIISLIEIFENTIYKIGLNSQESILSHIIIAQTILFISFTIMGFKSLIEDIKSKKILKKDIFLITILNYFFLIFQAFCLKNLPFAIFVLQGLIPVILLPNIYIENKFVRFNFYFWICLFLLFLAFFLLTLI